VQTALKEAKKVRRALREEEERPAATRAPSDRAGDSRAGGEGRKIDLGRRGRSAGTRKPEERKPEEEKYLARWPPLPFQPSMTDIV